MENTKINNWTNRMNSYVNKTSKHLFMDENKRFFKVIPFEFGDDNMVASIRFNDKYFWMTFTKVEAKSSESLFFLKRGYFPEWIKTTSLPNFKSMREVTDAIKLYLERNYDGTADKTNEIKDFIKELVKEENFIQKDLTIEE